jgi:UDP-glucose 4-epimerase
VTAHQRALDRAPTIGFGRYIISATTPFTREDLQELRTDAPAVVARHVPEYRELYDRLGWSMFPSIERVYDNAHARNDLGWTPRYDFRYALSQIAAGLPGRSDLATTIGAKGYHATSTGPYTVR